MMHMVNDTEEDFIRHWSERVNDEAHLAQLESIRDHLVDYAMNGWRPMSIDPPENVMLYTTCEEGVVLMKLTNLGEWRTSAGMPHKPPLAWMPAPAPFKPNGKGRK